MKFEDYYNEEILDRCYLLARRVTYCHHTAEDIVHDVMTKFHLEVNKEDIKDLENFLLRSTKNAAIDKLRMEGLRKGEVNVEELEGFQFSDGPKIKYHRQVEDCPSKIAEREEAKEIVRKSMEELPDLIQGTMTLYHFQDLSREQLADLEGLTVAGVKARLSNGLKILRKNINEEVYFDK